MAGGKVCRDGDRQGDKKGFRRQRRSVPGQVVILPEAFGEGVLFNITNKNKDLILYFIGS